MKSHLLALSVVALGAIFVAPGCFVAEEPVVVGGPAVPLACTLDNDPCVSDVDCCSYICADDGLCGLPANGCFEDNVACVSDADCCSNLCADDGFCGYPSTVVTCLPDNAACAVNADCCSYLCATDGYYAANGAAGFFEQLLDESGSGEPKAA